MLLVESTGTSLSGWPNRIPYQKVGEIKENTSFSLAGGEKRRHKTGQEVLRLAQIKIPYLPTLGHKHYRGTLDQLGPDALLG
jgi:hypothetical protein